jgi:hypothetical protein
VAAGVLTANEVLDTALPVILDEDADFKVVASVRQLAALNDGRGGRSQVGKFITVYPNDDAQAVRLAAALDETTQGLRGPSISSDRPLRPDSLVHYRYGGFGDLQVRTQLGRTLPAIRTPDGSLAPDHRLRAYYAPPWAQDPFAAAGIAQAQPAWSSTIADRYVILAVLHTSPRSQLYLSLNLADATKCVVKRVADDGSDSVQRLRNEAAVLERLAPDPRFPRPLELLEEARGVCLAMEDFDGQTLERHLISLRERNILPRRDELLRWACELADMLEAIHATGLVYRDLKAPNVVVAPDGRLRLVDFELAGEQDQARDEDHAPFGGGTRGYMSPRQAAGEAASVADDVYSLGALLYLIASGAEPSLAPDPEHLLHRPVDLLHPALGPALARVIGRCLDPDPGRRPHSPAAVAAALCHAGETASAASAVLRSSEAGAREGALDLARRIGDMLCESLEQVTDAQARGRVHAGPLDEEPWSLDLNMGAAGAILVLAEVVAEFDDPAHRDALEQGARWLSGAPRTGGTRLPGLYVGEAGIAAAQLRAGQVLGDADLVNAAAQTGRWLAGLPQSSPDLFNGTAGILRFHLFLWQQTAAQEHLDHAVAAAEQLLAFGADATGTLDWTIPPGYDALSGQRLTGYAHGAAGIADVLLDLVEITGASELLDAARSVGRWLEDLAKPVLENGTGLNWPSDATSSPKMAFWCHGAAGIARFLLHLGHVGHQPEAIGLARAAALVVAEGTRWSGVTQCHGLAGNVECLLDVYQATGEERYLRDARSLGRLLHAFAIQRDGRLVLITDVDRSHPGFSIGGAGVAACLLRLADPQTRPHLLSLRGFSP